MPDSVIKPALAPRKDSKNGARQDHGKKGADTEKPFFIVVAGIIMMLFLNVTAEGNVKKNYVVAQAGIYAFTDHLKNADFATGFNGGIAYGHYLVRNIILEGGISYFHDGVNKVYGNYIKGVPLTLTLKGVYRIKEVEIFAGAGASVNFVEFHGLVNGIFIDRSRDTVIGGHAVIGSTIDILDSVFVGLEGKYILTDTADFTALQTRLDGYTVQVLLGYRF